MVFFYNKLLYSDFQIVNGAVYKDYIYALAIPTNINDKASRIIKFNKEFEILEETYLNTYELIDNMIYFYQYNDRLFLIGVDSLLGYLKIVEVDENLQITNIKKYNDLEWIVNTKLNNFFKGILTIFNWG